MSRGTPVIAYAGGGYVESVIDKKTGILFHKPTVESLVQAIYQFTNLPISTNACIAQAQKFSKSRFKKELKAFIASH
jgi:glycosyltransferase involved in cell wall biosynthesis